MSEEKKTKNDIKISKVEKVSIDLQQNKKDTSQNSDREFNDVQKVISKSYGIPLENVYIIKNSNNI